MTINEGPVVFVVVALVVALGMAVFRRRLRTWAGRNRGTGRGETHAVPGRASAWLAVVVAVVGSAVVLVEPRFDTAGAGFFVLWSVLAVPIAPRGYRQFQARTGDVGVRDGDDGARL